MEQFQKKRKIQQIFLDCKHDLYMLFDAYERETAILLTEEEYGWMKKYLHSLEEVDAKSDFFRFPLEDEFLLNYQNKFLDIVDMANSMLQAYGIIQKCLEIQEENRIDRFDALRSSVFFTICKPWIWELLFMGINHRRWIS